jgi:hypothetical protein
MRVDCGILMWWRSWNSDFVDMRTGVLKRRGNITLVGSRGLHSAKAQ